MADVFSQIYIQTVFSVKHRQALIAPEWEEALYKYTTGIVQNRGHKMLAIGGMPDHIHIFIGLKPAEALSDLVREIKKATNEYIEEMDWCGAGYYKCATSPRSLSQSDLCNSNHTNSR